MTPLDSHDTAFSLAGNQFTKGIGAFRAAQLEAQTGQLAKDLVEGGLVSGTSTTYGKVVSYAAGPLVDKGINGVTSFFGKQPFAAGTNNVRNQIQDTVNSLESQTQDLAGTLTSQRETYRKHCQ